MHFKLKANHIKSLKLESSPESRLDFKILGKKGKIQPTTTLPGEGTKLCQKKTLVIGVKPVLSNPKDYVSGYDDFSLNSQSVSFLQAYLLL